MPDAIAADEARQLIERAETIIEEKKAANDDLKDVFLEAKSRGYDVKTMKRIIQLRAIEKDKRDEQDAILETYRTALGV